MKTLRVFWIRRGSKEEKRGNRIWVYGGKMEWQMLSLVHLKSKDETWKIKLRIQREKKQKWKGRKEQAKRETGGRVLLVWQTSLSGEVGGVCSNWFIDVYVWCLCFHVKRKHEKLNSAIWFWETNQFLYKIWSKEKTICKGNILVKLQAQKAEGLKFVKLDSHHITEMQ